MSFLSIEAFSDQGWLFRFVQEEQAIQFARSVLQQQYAWLRDVVPAYLSVACLHDPDQIEWRVALKILEQMPIQPPTQSAQRRVNLPVCYELGEDLPRVAELLQLSGGEIIHLHTQQMYTIYAIGFCPGFPYMGYLPEQLQGVPRLASPRLQVPAGSVGLTGKQTGIYPLIRPGGWHLIGRTPIRLVDVAENYFPLQVGDQVQFRSIRLEEYQELEQHPAEVEIEICTPV